MDTVLLCRFIAWFCLVLFSLAGFDLFRVRGIVVCPFILIAVM